MTGDPPELCDQLRRFVSRCTSHDTAAAPVKKLKGDASNRSYWRVGTRPSWVVMVMPKDAGRSEEASKGGPVSELPFVDVQRYLKRLGVRVPEIVHYDRDAGMMTLEDLGDRTFEAELAGGPEVKERLYERAVDLLAGMRAAAERSADRECLAFQRAFDRDLYDWELHHFREYGLEARYSASLSGAERRELDSLFAGIAAALDAEPKGFTHRDYQSRNLMLVGDELVVIDFQDALLGPRQYDLVALLRDSYVQLDRPFLERMVERWLAAFERAGGERLDRTRFLEVFDLLTLQRKLKDAGRFEFIARVKGNPSFLPYVEPSLAYVRAAFERVPQAAELRGLLSRHVPELR